jgi:hypothetical protein
VRDHKDSIYSCFCDQLSRKVKVQVNWRKCHVVRFTYNGNDEDRTTELVKEQIYCSQQ